MLGHATPVRTRREDDEPGRDRVRVPPEFDADSTPEAPLPVRRRQHVLEIDELCLELDHQQCSARGLVGQEVDASAFSRDRERHFGPDGPPSSPTDRRCHGLAQPRVFAVQQSIELATAPPQSEVQPDLQGRSDAAHRVERRAPDVPALDPRDRAVRDARPGSERGLRQSGSVTEPANDKTHGAVVHSRRMGGRSSLALTNDCAAQLQEPNACSVHTPWTSGARPVDNPFRARGRPACRCGYPLAGRGPGVDDRGRPRLPAIRNM